MQNAVRGRDAGVNRAKAFWLAFGCTLLAVVPLYLFAAACSLAQMAPADTVQSGVPIVHPAAGDAKTLLVMTGESEPQTFALVRFDAVQNTLCVASAPAGAQVYCAQNATTLAAAVRDAGPAQAAAALAETLDIPVDNYLFCSSEKLAALCAGLGNAQLRLANYVSPDALAQLQLAVPGVGGLTLTPEMLLDVLAHGGVPRAAEPMLRAQGYLAFLSAGASSLSQTLPDALRGAAADVSTDLTAVQIYEYERILKFLDKQEPKTAAFVLPGDYQGEVYLLDPGAKVLAAQQLGGKGAKGAGESGAPSADVPPKGQSAP